DVMYLHRYRELQTVGMGSNGCKNCEGTQTLVVQLGRGSSGADISCIQPNSIPYMEVGCGDPSSISVLLLPVLGEGHLSPEVVMYLLHGINKLCTRDFRVTVHRLRFLQQVHTGVVAIISEERGDTSSFRGVVVCCEFCHGEPQGPVVLLVVHIGSQVLFHDSINSFRLTISLGVECS